MWQAVTGLAANPYIQQMSTVTRDPIVCECGHTGSVKCRENDQPYSTPWEAHSLEGFEGGTHHGFVKNAVELLSKLNPTCPVCGQTGKVRYAQRP